MYFFLKLSGTQQVNNRLSKQFFYALMVLIMSGGTLTAQKQRKWDEFFGPDAKCYNRKKESFCSKVDSHNHFRPFGGHDIPFPELMKYFRKTGVLVVNAYGIGQTLPSDGTCTYYLDCPGTAVTPSLRNDFVNAANYLEYQGIAENQRKDPFEGKGRIKVILSMTFPDLANPQRIVEYINLMDREYPGLFNWMGETNLVKQALFDNKQPGATLGNIKLWKPFMDTLKKRKIPINIHSDIGNDTTGMQTKYLNRMEAVLNRYNDNKIVWSHMGLSKELITLDPDEHIAILKRLLDKHPNLTLDLSWDVLWDKVFKYEDKRDKYVAFINAYPTRFITGTDFVASRKGKNFKTYKKALIKTSLINQYMNDEAFRRIALGQNYYDLIQDLIEEKLTAPRICGSN